ncbi:hypothetical protein SAMN05421505_105169 [Sinosporangium album]|uniref:Uncharacterized protein n=1 Tax=Sinosporangium album TaxID=504805 RepID=A0A1G7V9S3_9ACTN|nr:hypothetical protein [Sinosporangium album]SDG56089.1 hypothetical protein SAMN05421505_105169 [Sinosporangium album]
MGDWFQERVIETERLPLFCFFVALIVAFVFTRINVRLIRANVRWWFKNVNVGDVHVHHVVFGVVLMLVGGVAGLITSGVSSGWFAVTAAVFGVGAALVLDEFALILHLRDVYWSEEGRTSVDAVFVAVAMTGLLLLGLRPLGWETPDGTAEGAWIAVGLIAANLVLAIVTLLKGKIWTGLVGLFVPFLLIIGAIRLARPGSPWAHWFFALNSNRPRPGKWAKAVHREERLRRPVIRAKISFQEFLSGRHDLPSPIRRLSAHIQDTVGELHRGASRSEHGHGHGHESSTRSRRPR